MVVEIDKFIHYFVILSNNIDSIVNKNTKEYYFFLKKKSITKLMTTL